MATGKALIVKPSAGNPHVRFEEGEVALSATLRRGSLLCKMNRRRNLARSIILGVAVAMATRLAAAVAMPANTCIVSGSTVRNPPSDSSVAFSGALDSTWRAVAAADVQTKFRPRKPVGLRIIFR